MDSPSIHRGKTSRDNRLTLVLNEDGDVQAWIDGEPVVFIRPVCDEDHTKRLDKSD